MQKGETPRRRAVQILIRWEKEGLPLDLVMTEELLDMSFADPRDYQFCRALVIGVVRWRGYLDAILSRYASHPLAKMKPLTMQALRCGLFQLVGMDRVPASAAINETVSLLKEAGQPHWLTGFVNGLLRRCSRDLPDLPRIGAFPADYADWPPFKLLSHPEWLWSRWVERYGEDRAEAICRANNGEAELTLRGVDGEKGGLADRLRGAGIEVEPGLYAPTSLLLHGYKGTVSNLPGYEEGLFQVQDEAAQLVSLLMGPLGPGRYLDACAGLGGKTTHLGELLGKEGQLVAVEPEPRRLDLLAANLQRLHLSDRVEIFAGELRQLSRLRDEKFSGILLDAPCSGTGVIRRHPDIRWNRQEADLLRYQGRQLALLNEATALLAPGGHIVYVTCSTEPEENEQVLEKFLAAHPGFAVEDCRNRLPSAAMKFIGPDGYFRTLPDLGLDGFFSARLRSKG